MSYYKMVMNQSQKINDKRHTHTHTQRENETDITCSSHNKNGIENKSTYTEKTEKKNEKNKSYIKNAVALQMMTFIYMVFVFFLEFPSFLLLPYPFHPVRSDFMWSLAVSVPKSNLHTLYYAFPTRIFTSQ